MRGKRFKKVNKKYCGKKKNQDIPNTVQLLVFTVKKQHCWKDQTMGMGLTHT